MNHKIVLADQIVDSALDEIDAGTALVIADSDGACAVEVARTITSNRTAIFVGNLANADEEAAAAEMARELFDH